MIEVYLCKHKGLFGRIIRFVTASNFDHICIKDKVEGSAYKDCFIDFNYPKGLRIFPEQESPWIKAVKVGEIKIRNHFAFYAKLTEVEMDANETYAVKYNFNYVLYKLFKLAPFKGYNCVRFFSEVLLDSPPPKCIKYGSPLTLFIYLYNLGIITE